MIFIIIAIISIIILAVLFRKEFEVPKMLVLFCGIAFGLLVDLIVFGIINIQCSETVYSSEIVSSVELVALQDESSTAGSFFLGCGSVNNNEYYAFYYQTENGVRYDKIPADNDRYPVYIKYISGDEQPHIDKYSGIRRQYYKEPDLPIWLSFIAWVEYGKYEPGVIISENRSVRDYDDQRYEIYLPKDSIKQDYTIDFE